MEFHNIYNGSPRSLRQRRRSTYNSLADAKEFDRYVHDEKRANISRVISSVGRCSAHNNNNKKTAMSKSFIRLFYFLR